MENLDVIINKSLGLNILNIINMFLLVLFSVIVIFMFVCGVLGNLLVIFVLVWILKRYKWKNFYCFVGVFFIMDLFGILVLIFFVFVNYLNNFEWVGG